MMWVFVVTEFTITTSVGVLGPIFSFCVSPGTERYKPDVAKSLQQLQCQLEMAQETYRYSQAYPRLASLGQVQNLSQSLRCLLEKQQHRLKAPPD